MQYVKGLVLPEVNVSLFFLVEKWLPSGVVALHCLVSLTVCYMLISHSVLQQLLTRLILSTSAMEKLHTGLTRGETIHLKVYIIVQF